MMMSEPRAPRWSAPGRTAASGRQAGGERGQHRGRLVLGDLLVGGAAPVSTVAVNTSVVRSGPAMDRSTAMLTFLSKSAALGVPVNTSPRLLEMPDSVVPPVASLVSSTAPRPAGR